MGIMTKCLLGTILLCTMLLCTMLLGLLCPSSASAKARRFYCELRGVQEPKGTSPSLKDKAKTLLMAELKKHPRVVLDLGSPPPRGEELSKSLKANGLDGYALVLRITKASHSLNPPAAGKVYKVLMVEVEVSIDAEKIPSGQMALAGQGSTQVGTEVNRFKDKERVELLHEALATATREAVSKSIAKLGGGKKRVKKRRSRRRKKR
jgi:hypothetical protein